MSIWVIDQRVPIFVVFLQPSHNLHIEVLRRPFESTQYVSIRYTERLVEGGIEPSVDSVGDSYDNALAEMIIGLYKTELIRQRDPWGSIEPVELGTPDWVDWFNIVRAERRRAAGGEGRRVLSKLPESAKAA